jgi:membrane fusion protein (multidrug efflux system)
MNDSDTSAPAASPPTGSGRQRILLILGGVFTVLAVGWLLLWLLVFSRRETTDDAYVAGDQVGVSSQTGGTVIEVLADDTQRVEAGQVLVRLDPTDNDAGLARAAAALSLSVRQARQQLALAAQGDAQVASRRLELAQAEEQLARRRPLLAQAAIGAEELAQSSTTADLARATLQAAEQQAAAAHALVDGSTIATHPAVQEARAAYVQAWVSAHRAIVRAPVSGYVARRNVQVGQRITAGQPLLTIIPLDALWVDANFKEGQLRALRIGQPVRVHSDLYGGSVEFHGHVAGMAAGTGAAFSLLPAQNATGNWIKVVQRVPVRIALDPRELAEHPLRIGLSTTINVDTQDRGGAVLAAGPASTSVGSTAIYAEDNRAAEQAADALIPAQARTHP